MSEATPDTKRTPDPQDLAVLRKQVEAARDDLIAEGRHKSVDWLPYLPINGVLSLLDRIEELERVNQQRPDLTEANPNLANYTAMEITNAREILEAAAG